MANTHQSVGSTLGAAAKSPRPSAPGTDSVDVSHLRPLSEGVLRAVGLHGGFDSSTGNVRDLRGKLDGAEDLDPDKLPSDEPHVRLMRLEKDRGGYTERNVLRDGTVSLRFTYGDGDVVTVVGANTVECVDKLIAKMGGIK